MIEAILARGTNGAMGLNGKLPWHSPEDLAWFKQVTMGKVCIAGANTMKTLPSLFGRCVVCDIPGKDPMEIAPAYNNDIIIIGGPKTYARWAPYIQRWHIGVVKYDGPADCWFDPSWVEGYQ